MGRACPGREVELARAKAVEHDLSFLAVDSYGPFLIA